jgi:hypothetical protein
VQDWCVPESDVESKPLPAAAAAALSTGHLIEAIKQVRVAEGIGLMEAKLRIEAHVNRNPVLKSQFAEQQLRMKRRVIRWVVVLDTLLFAAIVWYFFIT